MTTPMGGPPPAREQGAEVPHTFFGYLRSFGPGLIVVMTWLGAGDIVEMSVAGGNYGYALMWVIVVAVAMRYVFVSLIAKYQLCNPHGEGVLDGLSRLHWLYAPFLMVSAIVMGHVYESYVTVGIGEAFVNLFGRGTVWGWAALWNGLALAIVFRPVYGRVERVFKGLLVVLTLSFLGTALWVGPSPSGILRGTLAFALPDQVGQFSPLLITIGMLGAIGGSLLNLVYPYFLEDKGWTQPKHRRVQTYDFLLAMVVMIVLDLSVWTLGAELLHAQGLQIATMDDLPRLLSEVLGRAGRTLFYVGIFAVLFTSVIGFALGLARMASHGFLRWRAGSGPLEADYRTHWSYRAVVVWCLVSPLIWTAPGMPGFITLTLVANSAQVVLMPFIAAGLWRITASTRFIGPTYRNRWWENAVMAFLFVLSLWAAAGSIRSVVNAIV
jgi:Mn2+/Fe2+ NRAMP family transporter